MRHCATTPSLYTAILYQSRQNPFATAVVAEGREISYRAFCTHIERVTRRLHALALPTATRVVVDIHQSVYLRWVTIVALARLGMVSASPSGPNFESLGGGHVLSERPPPEPSSRVTHVEAGWLDKDSEALAPWRDVRFPEDAACRLVESSGTTGVPKKVVLTHGQVRARILCNIRAYGLNAGSRLWTTMGAGTIGGFMMLVSCWSSGGAVLLPKDSSRLDRDWLAMRPNIIMTSPMQLAMLLRGLPGGFWHRERPAIYVAGSSVSPALSRSTRLRLTDLLFVVYGSTEAGSVTMAHSSTADERPGFTGYVLPSAEVEIVDEEGAPVAAGETGEVRIRAEGMVDGYVDETGEPDHAFRDGWFYPGDLGSLAADGALNIAGRTREVMNFGGRKIAPELMERALAACPGISDMAAFSIAGPTGIERPWLAVVASADFNEEALANEFRRAFPRLPPVTVTRVDTLPRNEMGKVQRMQLAQQVRQRLNQ